MDDLTLIIPAKNEAESLPIVLNELKKYKGCTWMYLSMRPGLTGLWQVSGADQRRYSDRIRLDSRYQQEISLWTDLKILLQTVPEVLRRINGVAPT